MRRATVGFLAGALALTLATPADAGITKVVKLVDISIKPATVRISRGDTVKWQFLDGSAPHNVTSRGSTRFRSSPTKQSGTYSVRFRKAGTYRYVCTIHPNMVGKVVVR